MIELRSVFYAVSLFLVGAAALAMPSGYSVGFYLICGISVWAWLKKREDLIPQNAKYFLIPLLVYGAGFCALALTEKWALREINTHIPFVLVLFVFWGLRKFKPKSHWFWMGLATGALIAAAISGYQSIILSARAGGFTNPIQFGNIALLFGVLCMVRAMAYFDVSRLNVLLWFGFLSGVAASVWSQTRGGWLAVVMIFIWILFNVTKGWSSVKRICVSLLLLTVLTIPALKTGGVVQTRISQAVAEFNDFFETGRQDTSVGARLAMWSLALEGVAQAPLLGVGDAGWIKMRDTAIDDGRLSAFSSTFTHVHSEYLNIVLKRGLVGLALYMALYLVPMVMFFKPYLQDRRQEVRAFAIAGMVIPMMFMDFGLTQTFLSHNSGRMVLVSLWVCVAALMLNAQESE